VTIPARLAAPLEQIRFARKYTLWLLEDIPADQWFRMPAEGVTHLAWQVGHLAMAEYRLALERIRGTQPDDDALISPAFLAAFGKGSEPVPDRAAYPSIDEIRRVFDRVHERVLSEATQVADAELDLPPHKPHRLFNTRLESYVWCSQHEMLHAGQNGLLRRLLGTGPRW
jgi:hypothetical protein